MKHTTRRKLCAIAMAAVLLTGVGAVGSAVPAVSAGLTVSAAETLTADSFDYTIDGNGEITITRYYDSDTENVVIPDHIGDHKITAIGYGAFRNRNFKSIVLPDSITTIAENAFLGCGEMESIQFGSGVKTFGKSALAYCRKLQSVTLPEGITEIEEYLLTGCENLKSVTLPEGITSIGQHAFASCWNLQKINIPDGVTSIYREAFEGCVRLFDLSFPDSVSYVDYEAFNSCGWYNQHPAGDVYVGSVYYGYQGAMPAGTSVVIKEGTKSITPLAFYDCVNLASVTIPDGIKEIDSSTFSGCTSLTSVRLPSDLERIQNGVFEGCTRLTRIVLPESLSSISFFAFADCTRLKNITIPKNIADVDNDAFTNTAWLKAQPDGDLYFGKTYLMYKGTMPENTTVTIKEGTVGIGGDAFAEQTNLIGVVIPESVRIITGSTFYGCTGLKSVRLPEGLDKISWGMFMDCTALTDVNIPDGVTEISYSAFSGCTALKTVKLPESVTTIRNAAFEGCKNIKTLDIPENVTEIGPDAFYQCNPNLILCGKPGTYVQQYAIDNEIAFRVRSLLNTSRLSADSIALGQKVTVECSANYGTPGYYYSIYYRKAGDTKWKTLETYTYDSAVDFKPTEAGDYEIRVIAYSLLSKTARKDMKLTVTKALTNTSKLGAESIKVGEKVKVRCFAEGGAGDYEFAVYYKLANEEKFTKLRGYKAYNIIMFTPSKAGTYDIRVFVRDTNGKLARKDLRLNVT